MVARPLGAKVRAAVVTAVRRLLPAAAALVILSGLLQAGRAYFYCTSMDELLAAPCCAHQGSPHAAPQVTAPDSQCCVSVSVAHVPAGSSASPGETPAAPLVAILSPALRGAASPAALRAGPKIPPAVGPPRSACARRSALRVFLI